MEWDGYYERVDPATGHVYRYWWRTPKPGEFKSEPLGNDWKSVGYMSEDGVNGQG